MGGSCGGAAARRTGFDPARAYVIRVGTRFGRTRTGGMASRCSGEAGRRANAGSERCVPRCDGADRQHMFHRRLRSDHPVTAGAGLARWRLATFGSHRFTPLQPTERGCDTTPQARAGLSKLPALQRAVWGRCHLFASLLSWQWSRIAGYPKHGSQKSRVHTQSR